MRRADDCLGDVLEARRDAKVGEFHLCGGGQQHIRRLDVSVHSALLQVQVLQRNEHLGADCAHLVRTQRPVLS